MAVLYIHKAKDDIINWKRKKTRLSRTKFDRELFNKGSDMLHDIY